MYNPKNTSANIEAYYALRLNTFDMEVHRHASCEIMYAAEGECTVYAGDQVFPIKERQFIFLDGLIPHRLVVTGPCSLLNLQFCCFPQNGGLNYAPVRENCPAFRQMAEGREPFFVRQETGKLGHALRDLIAELDAAAKPDVYVLGLLFERMLVELARCYMGSRRAAGSRYLNLALQFIEGHLLEPLDVETVAKHAGVNHSYLQTLFSDRFGCGIIAYINAQRMETAAFLLQNTRDSVIDIACHLGYNSRQHFGYLFKKHFGMSPKTFRKLKGEALYADTGGFQLVADAGQWVKQKVAGPAARHNI